MELDDSKLLANTGPTADRHNFTEYIQKNMTLYELTNNLSLSTHAAANYTRGQVPIPIPKLHFVSLPSTRSSAPFSSISSWRKLFAQSLSNATCYWVVMTKMKAHPCSGWITLHLCRR
jgi:hypothetical protein